MILAVGEIGGPDRDKGGELAELRESDNKSFVR